MLSDKDDPGLVKRISKDCQHYTVIEANDWLYVHAQCQHCSAPIKIQLSLEDRITELESIVQQLSSEMIQHKSQ